MGKELMEELPDELFSNISATLAVAKPGQTVVDAVAETLRGSDQMLIAKTGGKTTAQLENRAAHLMGENLIGGLSNVLKSPTR